MRILKDEGNFLSGHTQKISWWLIFGLLAIGTWNQGIAQTQGPGRLALKSYRTGHCEQGDQHFHHFRMARAQPAYPRLESERHHCYSRRMNWDPSREDTVAAAPDLVPEYNLLPFGAGQYQNGDSILGTSLLVLQGAALAYGAMSLLESSQLEADIQAKQQSALKSGEVDKEELEKWKKKQLQVANDKWQTGTTALSVFAGLWVVGTVESIITYRSLTKAHKLRRQRRVYGLSYDLEIAPVKHAKSMIKASYSF